MKLLYGLGNPDDENKLSRHNTGWMALDKLHSIVGEPSLWQINKEDETNTASGIIGEVRVVLCKPRRYMNDQGSCLERTIKRHGLSVTDDVMVIHDDLDLRLGMLRLKQKGSPPSHNGLTSIRESLRSDLFWRLRIGIDSRKSRTEMNGEDFVLSDFTEEETQILYPNLSKATEIATLWISGQCEKAVHLTKRT